LTSKLRKLCQDKETIAIQNVLEILPGSENEKKMMPFLQGLIYSLTSRNIEDALGKDQEIDAFVVFYINTIIELIVQSGYQYLMIK
jgi:hypothetical protein